MNLDDVKESDIQHINSFDDIDFPDDQLTDYCYVVRPGETQNSLIQHGNCEIPEMSDDADANGLWNVVSGVKGKTQEYTFQVNVQTTGMFMKMNNNNKISFFQ